MPPPAASGSPDEIPGLREPLPCGGPWPVARPGFQAISQGQPWPGFFDGCHLYEMPERQEIENKEWATLIFNSPRTMSPRNFLVDNLIITGLRVHIDRASGWIAVASDLYRDYSGPMASGLAQ